MAQRLEDLPGFRRRFRITPAPGQVRVELEDDFHCMSVSLEHRDDVITNVAAKIARAPWSTCPGAEAQVVKTFIGTRLSEATARGEKTSNCTHLHDMTLLGAAHAADEQPLTYDVLSSDPVGGRAETELRVNGEPVMHWTIDNSIISAPKEIAGLTLMQLTKWILSLPAPLQEQARILRWGSMIAHGRNVFLPREGDPDRFNGRCYTYQPRHAQIAHRAGKVRDFSTSGHAPLEPQQSRAGGEPR